MKKYCTYIRVSTQRQGNSGLGMDSQRKMCADFIRQNDGELAREFVDVESGTHRDRKGLWDAINYCKANDTSLVIAKLDRLARDVEFCFKVINTGIDIHFTDMPVINSMILGVFSAVAQYERELISDRTKKALAAKKARGEAVGAQAEKYKMTMANKCPAEIKSAHAKKGVTRNLRYLESRETQALIKCLKNTFPEATDHPNIAMWEWDMLNTKYDSRERFLRYMQDFKSVDPTLFPKWDLTGGNIQQRMANFIMVLRKSAMTMDERERNTKY